MLAIGTASKTHVASVILGELATVLLFSELDSARNRSDYESIMKDPKILYGRFQETDTCHVQSNRQSHPDSTRRYPRTKEN